MEIRVHQIFGYQQPTSIMSTNHFHVLTTLVLFLLLSICSRSCLSSGQPNQVDIRDYCALNGNDTFHPTCKPGHVIIMRHARYGRMRLGECVTADRDIGCYSDVLSQLHALCSGRRECSLQIPSSVLLKGYPCAKDDNFYLEAGYECQKVLNVDECQLRKPVQLSKFPGYLSTLIKPPIDPSSLNPPPNQPPLYYCNIKLTTVPGRTIRLKLHEFQQPAGPMSSSDCNEYATFTDDHGKNRSPVRICADKVGEREVALSSGPVMTVKIPILSTAESVQPFLLKYEAVGCADPKVPKGAQLNRTGMSARIVCNASQQTWNIICKDNKWIGLEHNCSDPVVGPPHDDDEPTPWSLGLLLAIVIGVLIGVLLGMLCLCTVTCVYRRGCSDRTRYERASHPRAHPHEHVHMLPPDHAYECARTLPHTQTIPNYDQNCPYHSLRHNKDMSQLTSPRLGYGGEKPSIVQDCETCVDHNQGGQNEMSTFQHGGQRQYAPDQTLHVKQFLHEDIIPYNVNDRNFTGGHS